MSTCLCLHCISSTCVSCIHVCTDMYMYICLHNRVIGYYQQWYMYMQDTLYIFTSSVIYSVHVYTCVIPDISWQHSMYMYMYVWCDRSSINGHNTHVHVLSCMYECMYVHCMCVCTVYVCSTCDVIHVHLLCSLGGMSACDVFLLFSLPFSLPKEVFFS